MELLLAKVTLFLLFLQVAGLLFRQSRSNALYCGLWGFCGKRDVTPNIDKIKILGLYNEYIGNRGGDGVGIWYADTLMKGVDKEKKWGDYIEWNTLYPMEGYNTMLCHTRWQSAGSKSGKGLEDTHPFKVNNLVLTHNGTIKNIQELCFKFNVEYVDSKVDSLLFAEIMDKIGWYEFPKLLSSYKGHAALVFQDAREPNSLYLYHGAAIEYKNAVKEIEERPLYILKTEEGIYYSSMFDSLCAIRDDDAIYPEEVPHNRIIKITNGKLTNVKVNIDRGECNVGINTYGSYYTRPPHTPTTPTKVVSLPPSTTKVDPIIYRETTPTRSMREGHHIYFFRGRYWVNEHGTHEICNGSYIVDKRGNVISTITNVDWVDNRLQYYFYRGIMMKSEASYKDVLRESQTPHGANYCYYDSTGSFNFAMHISQYSRWPVSNLMNEARGMTGDFKYMWYVDTKITDGSFAPKFSDRQYSLKRGVLTSITDTKKEKTIEQPELFEDEERKKVVETFKKEAERVEKNLASHLKFARIIYNSEDEMMAEVPETVWRALYLYYKDLLDNTLGKNNYLDSEIDDLCEGHIKTCINDKVSLEDNMQAKHVSMEEYIMEAMQEEEEEKETDELPFPDEKKKIEVVSTFPDDLDKWAEEKDTEEFLKNTIANIKSMKAHADRLSLNTTNELAQETALDIFRSIDRTIAEMSETLEKQGKKEFLKELQSINKA